MSGLIEELVRERLDAASSSTERPQGTLRAHAGGSVATPDINGVNELQRTIHRQSLAVLLLCSFWDAAAHGAAERIADIGRGVGSSECEHVRNAQASGHGWLLRIVRQRVETVRLQIRELAKDMQVDAEIGQLLDDSQVIDREGSDAVLLAGLTAAASSQDEALMQLARQLDALHL